MRYIKKGDEELIQTINIVSKFPQKESEILGKLHSNYINNPYNLEAAIAYGFFKYISITRLVLGTDLMRTDILHVLDVYDEVLQVEPDYWLVRLLKLLLYRDLPIEMTDLEQVRENFENIIYIQKEAEQQEPYFIMPYIIYADYLFSANQLIEALIILQQGEKIVIKRKIKSSPIGEYFSRVARDFYNRLLFSNQIELSTVLKTLGKVFFLSEKVFI